MICLMLLGTLTLTSCSLCEKKVYVKVPYTVEVPVKCIVPDADCSFDRNSSVEVITGLLECIVDMKYNMKVCQ